LITPKGIREKSLITSKFLVRKKQEFEALKKEIDSFEEALGNVLNEKKIDKSKNK